MSRIVTPDGAAIESPQATSLARARKDELQSALWEAYEDNPGVEDRAQHREVARKLRAAVSQLDAKRDSYVETLEALEQAEAAVAGAGSAPPVELLAELSERRADRFARLCDLLVLAQDGCYEIMLETIGGKPRRVFFDALFHRAELTQPARLAQVPRPPEWRPLAGGWLLRKLFRDPAALCDDFFQPLRRAFPDELPAASAPRDARSDLLLLGRTEADYADQRIVKQHDPKLIFSGISPDGRRVILKRFQLVDRSLRNHLRELQLLYKYRELSCVVNIEGYFVEVAQGRLNPPRYLVLQLAYMERGDLAAHFRSLREQVEAGTMPKHEHVAELRRVLHHLAEALVPLHSDGVEHRDVKPENVLMAERGQQLWPVLSDFEVGRDKQRIDAGLTIASASTAGQSLGTPGYRPPQLDFDAQSEQATRRHMVGAGDVWSLGVTILYEALYDCLSADDATERLLHEASRTWHSTIHPLDHLKSCLAQSVAHGHPAMGDAQRQPFLALAAELLFLCPSMSDVVKQNLMFKPLPLPRLQALTPPVPAPASAAAGSSAQHAAAGSSAQHAAAGSVVGLPVARSPRGGSSGAQPALPNVMTLPGVGGGVSKDQASALRSKLTAQMAIHREANPVRARGSSRPGELPPGGLKVSYRQAHGQSSRVSELLRAMTLLTSNRGPNPAFREALFALYLQPREAGRTDTEVDVITRLFAQGSDGRKAIDEVISTHKRARKDAEKDDLHHDPPCQDLDRLSLRDGRRFWNRPCFWRTHEVAGVANRSVLEKLLAALAHEEAFAVIGEYLRKQRPGQLHEEFPVQFEGEEAAEDQGGVHSEMVSFFFAAVERRYLANGLLCERKARAAEALSAARYSTSEKAFGSLDKDLHAVGRMMLHCRGIWGNLASGASKPIGANKPIATALGLISEVYAAAVESTDPRLAPSAFGTDLSLAAMISSMPSPSWCEENVARYKGLVSAFLPDDDPFLNVLSKAHGLPFVSMDADHDPLTSDRTSDGESAEVVTSANLDAFQFLVLRRKLFGAPHSATRRAIGALSSGLRAWGNGVYEALKAMPPALLVDELEGGHRDITLDQLLNLVDFDGYDAEQHRGMFAKALSERHPQTQEPLLDLSSVLRWITGLRFLNGDFSLRPCKKEPFRSRIKIDIDREIDGFRAHICFYELHSPCFDSAVQMREAIEAVYLNNTFNAR